MVVFVLFGVKAHGRSGGGVAFLVIFVLMVREKLGFSLLLKDRWR